MGEVFEGDNTNYNEIIAEDLDLFEIANKYKDLWKLPEKSAHHVAIDRIIQKNLTHDNYVKIKTSIRNTIGKKDYSRENFKFTEKKLKEWGLSNEKISAIHQVLQLETVDSNALCKIKECGIHLVRAFKVFYGEHDDTFLNEDYNVRTNLTILFFKNKLITPQEATQIAKSWNGYRSTISLFLHRLKHTSTPKLLEEEELTAEDFYEIY